MGIATRTLDFFLSVKTTVVLLLGLVIFMVAGAFVMPMREEYASINAIPLLKWLGQTPVSATWWILGSAVLLTVLALNTVVCGARSLFKRPAGRHWLWVLAPQIVHLGFLLMLLGHLVSSVGGISGSLMARDGTMVNLRDGLVMRISGLDVTLSPKGYPLDWRASVQYMDSSGQSLGSAVLRPNKPSFFRGYGVYLKHVKPYPMKSAHIEISREPGAVWALGGGLVFLLGTIALVGHKMAREK